MLVRGAFMDDKVNVSISEIDNGFLFRRTWHEPKKNSKKQSDDVCHQYCTEEFFLKTLPEPLTGLFKKGYIAKDKKKDVWDELKSEKIEITEGSEEDENY
jgi:hypothetical protein